MDDDQAAPAADEPARDHVVLTRDVEDLGLAGRVISSPPHGRAVELTASGQARPATEIDIQIADPFVINLEA